jgi:tripartite-type tricarboxylate transporter receptor subunit TctC
MAKSLSFIRATLVAFALAWSGGSALADAAYPEKPIRFIVPYAAGGAVSVLARLVGQKLNEAWGQPVIVDPRPGGGTVIGADAVVKSPPDGYTILAVASTHVTLGLLYPNIRFDPLKDFAPVATLASGEQVLLVHPSAGAESLRELIAVAKSKPGALNYASSGNGSPTNLAGELFKMMAGVDVQHIPYKGAAPAITDLIGGQVHMSFQNLAVALPHVRGGKVTALAVSGDSRSPALPQVPTFREAGLPGFEARFWFGVLAPAGTPRNIIDKLSGGIANTLSAPEIRQNLTAQGLEPFVNTPEQLAALMREDFVRYEKVIKAANIKVDN